MIRLGAGRLNTVIPWFFMASTSAQPKNNCLSSSAPANWA